MSEENVEIVSGVRYRISLPGEGASRRRTLNERFFTSFPALYRLLSDRLMRLPLRSRLRRLVRARIAGRAAAAVNRRDFDVLLVALAPGIEYHPARDVVPPGMDSVAHGHDRYVAVWRQMIDAFEDFHTEPEEVLDLGEQLLATVQYKGHGSGSGVPVNIPLFQLFRLRRGLVVWQKDFSDRAEALEAAGLRE
jgi:ketosteroid isomerase-like protein